MLEYYNGFLLTYVGLTGSDWSETGKGVRELLGRGGISDSEFLLQFHISEKISGSGRILMGFFCADRSTSQIHN